MINTCETCKREFVKKHNPNRVYKFCSKKCSAKDPERNLDGLQLGRGWNRGLKTGVVPPNAFPKGHKSWNAGTARILTCKFCGKSFKNTDHPTNVYCSVKCFRNGIGGENSHNWRGGVTPEIRRIRNQAECLSWAKAVKERDNFTCVLCGAKGGRLVSDHYPYAFYKYADKRFDLDNGRTLCKDCNYIETYVKQTWRKDYLNG